MTHDSNGHGSQPNGGAVGRRGLPLIDAGALESSANGATVAPASTGDSANGATVGPASTGDSPAGAHEGSHPGPSVADLRQRVAAARSAQWHWAQEPLDVRIAALRRAARAMLARRREVIDLAREEMGKVEAEGLFNEALGPLDTVSGWADVVKHAASRRRVRLNPVSFPRKTAWVDYLPRGVVGVIAPWNFPAAGLYRSIFPALMTGNAIVLKPSEYTPRTSSWLVERLADELPAGLAQSVVGDGRTGAALLDAGIDACVFTGSTRAGAFVRERCAALGIPSSIEMGGKDAAIVLADCDLPRTVAAITHWTLSNAGQACGAIEIAYVERSIADDFVATIARAWKKLTPRSVAPLAHPRQLEVVRSQVEDARARGARVVCGGEAGGPGLWYAPTILDGCDDRMAVMREETFGPVLAVARVESAHEAIRAVNAGLYGLGASIWSRDLARAARLAERLEVGVVNVNNHAFTGAVPALPWSGTRATGFGVANGPESLHTFVRPRTTTIDASNGPDLYWMPYDDDLTTVGQALADAQIGSFGGVLALPLAIRRRLRTIRNFFR